MSFNKTHSLNHIVDMLMKPPFSFNKYNQKMANYKYKDAQSDKVNTRWANRKTQIMPGDW